MPFLIDTDTASSTLRARPHTGVLRRMAAVPAEELCLSSIVVGELLYGGLRRGLPDLLERIELLVSRIAVLPFDEAAAREYARVRVELERAGRRLDDADLRIAATALAYDLTLVTGNERHFRRVPGLSVENWLDPEG